MHLWLLLFFLQVHLVAMLLMTFDLLTCVHSQDMSDPNPTSSGGFKYSGITQCTYFTSQVSSSLYLTSLLMDLGKMGPYFKVLV